MATRKAAIGGTALTRREREVAALVAEGLTNREIARRLFISERTADGHLEHIREKLGVSTRSQIATWFVAPPSDERSQWRRWPDQPGPLLGRRRELAEVREMVLRPDVRLLTLTGPPGTGKTRLASGVALDLASEFEGGAHFVDLSPIFDPGLVLSAIGQVVGGRPAIDGLVAVLRPRRTLLLLDNFDQVVAAAGQITDLLAACPELTIMATSRESLHLLRWEHEYQVGPLQLPDMDHLPPPDELSCGSAVALFVERARARNRQFALGEDTGRTVASICVRLDGLPLAIELAAAATRLLTPEAILSRLRERRDLTARGGADFPRRHHTLRDAIGASHELLSAPERTLFRRLGVFVGGFDLDALEAVCPGHDVPAGAAVTILAQLVDKSLVQVTAGGRRYRLLETIREYALERLSLDDDARAVLCRRDAHFVDLAERACAAFGTAANGGWFERLQQDVDNLRAVMSRAIAEREHATGLRLGAALSMFWRMRGYLGEGQGRLAEVVAAADERGEVERFPAALRELGILTGELSDHAAGKAHLDRYLARARPSGDGPGVAAALVSLGTWTTGEDLCEARRCLEEGLEVARACGDRLRVTVGLYKLALVAHLEGDQAMARSLVEESVARARDVGDDIHLAAGLVCRGRIEFDELRLNDASATWDEALRISMAGGSIWSLPTLLEGFARLSALRGGASVALRLAGASDALREVIGAPRTAIWYQDFDQRMDAAAGGAARSHPDWAAGRALPLDAAVDLAYTICQSAPGQGG